MKQIVKPFLIVFLFIVIILAVYFILNYYNIFQEKIYVAGDFNIETIKSENDYNKNGIDDYTDILIGARMDAENRPTYKSDSYTIGGYPPDNIGVCTDLIWRAFKNAGYLLKDMVDEDIKDNVSLYSAVKGKPDPNIDFRRVQNLQVFFDRYLTILTNDIYKIDEWQPGDIVIFGTNSHIGIISEKRNKNGIPYLLHNSGQYKREENAIENIIKNKKITRHYRMEKIPSILNKEV